jgi:alpha-ketoglutarate-dependent taurine dioxygenase
MTSLPPRFPPSGFPPSARRPIPASRREWVIAVGDVVPNRPLEVRPQADVDLATWAREHPSEIDRWLDRHGAVRFRGFGIGPDQFPAVSRALVGPPLSYVERSSPRKKLGHGVYSSTEHPADQPIRLHNENSYQHRFPARLAFGCVTPASSGGATPTADCRRVLDRLDPAIVRAFHERGVRYVRNFSDGLGLPWREAFQATDARQVDAYCGSAGITAEWRAGGRLHTSQTRPAIAVHPRTGEPTWFNHAAFFHVSSLEPDVRQALLSGLPESELPSNSYYGDGAPIEAEVLEEIRAAYEAERVAVPWESGDVLLLDNLLTAHGREPFNGSRLVLVSMGGETRHDQLPAWTGARR